MSAPNTEDAPGQKLESGFYGERDENGNDNSPARTSEEDDHKETAAVTGWRLWLSVFSLCLGCLFSLMDITIVSTAMYTISLEFNSFAEASWVVLAYTLCDVGFAVIFARISDTIGRKNAVLIAFTIFLAFSIGAGFAQTLQQLIVCRAFQGMGGAGLYALSIILITEISTPENTAVLAGLIGATVAMSGVLGPIVGGLLTHYASWRWVFWINGPCVAIAMTAFFIAWPKHIQGYAHTYQPWSHFDILGAMLFVSACVLLIFGLEEGGSGVHAWNSSVVIGTLVAACLSWPLLFLWEWFVSRTRDATIASVFPTRMLTNRVMLACLCCTILTGFPMFTVIFNLPLHFQIVNGDSPSGAGVNLLPFLCAAGVGAFIGGAVSSKKNRTFYTFVAAACFNMLGSGLLSTVSSSTSIEKKVYGFQVLLGIGMGMTFSSAGILISLNVDFRDHAVAQGIVAQMRVFGGSIGIAMANGLITRQARWDLKGLLTAAEIQALQTSTKILETLSPAEKQAVQQVYSDAFDTTMRICTYAAVVCLVSALCTYQRNPPSAGNPMERAERLKKEAAAPAPVLNEPGQTV